MDIAYSRAMASEFPRHRTTLGSFVLTRRFSYPSVWLQVLRHVSDRTGIISFANFPLIWFFGMRNNIFIWLTGWDFKTYNNFHRWVGRIATIQAVVHSVGYIIIIFQSMSPCTVAEDLFLTSQGAAGSISGRSLT